MAEALAGDRRIVRGLAEHEPALQHRLREAGQTGGIDARRRTRLDQGLLEVGLQQARLAEDAVGTGVAYSGAGRERLLDHRAGEARELLRLTADERHAEVDVGE